MLGLGNPQLLNMIYLNPQHTIFILLFSCAGTIPKQPKPSQEFTTYWYNNEAEISSYSLTQARYGELHKGEAVLVFVTEPFSEKKFVKSDNPTVNDIPVLKLNLTKKFNTGIYPYSIMTSVFTSITDEQNALKITCSSQEWCGHTFTQLENKGNYHITSHSYFETEGEQKFSLQKTFLEDDVWSKIRLSNQLPEGKVKMIPSFSYIRLMHKELKAYLCEITKTDSSITLSYPELDRTLSISYEQTFPFKILGWEETYSSGFGQKQQLLTTTAHLMKTIKSAYWEKHNNEDSYLREELKLK